MLVAGCSDGGEGMSNPDLSAIDGGNDMAAPVPTATHCAPASTPRLLSQLPGRHHTPRIGFTGAGYVVAWNTEVDNGGQPAYRIDLAITDADGNRLGPNVSLTSDPLADPSAPSVAALENGTVVAWSRITGSGTHIFLSSFDVNGQKLDGTGMACDPSMAECGLFQVTSAGNERDPFLTRPTVAEHTGVPTDNQVGLTWIGSANLNSVGSDVFWKKIQTNGTSLIPDIQLTSMTGAYALPRMAFDGTHQGLSWRDDARAPAADFYFATLDALGQISSQPTKVGSASGPYAALGSPDLIWSDGDYAMAAATGGAPSAVITLQRFAPNGVSVLPANGVTFGVVACEPAVAWDGEAYGLVWQTLCGMPGSGVDFELLDKAAQRLAPDGTLCPSSASGCGLVTVAVNSSTIQTSPEMTWAGGHSFAVTWTEESSSDGGQESSDVYFSRIDCD